MLERDKFQLELPQAQEDADTWMGYLREKVTALDSYKIYPQKDTDRQRAVWGVIVRDIHGDAGTRLMGAILIIEGNLIKQTIPSSKDLQNIKLGFATTWLICKDTFATYQKRLPQNIRNKLADSLELYDEVMQRIVSEKILDWPAMAEIGRHLYDLLHSDICSDPIIRNDIVFGTDVLNYIEHK